MPFFEIEDIRALGYQFTADSMEDLETFSRVKDQIEYTITEKTGLAVPVIITDRPAWSARICVWLAQFYCAPEAAAMSEAVAKDVNRRYEMALEELEEIGRDQKQQPAETKINIFETGTMSHYRSAEDEE